jgi:hypothetical protein
MEIQTNHLTRRCSELPVARFVCLVRTLFIVAAFLPLCLQAADTPDVLLTDFAGRTYVFDQEGALDYLNGAIQGLKSDMLKAKNRSVEYNFVDTNMDLYGILLGFAHVGKADARLKELLHKLKQECGLVSLPSFLGLGDEREQFWKSYVVREKDTGRQQAPDSLQPNFTLGKLVTEVEDQITKRTGERFDD